MALRICELVLVAMLIPYGFECRPPNPSQNAGYPVHPTGSALLETAGGPDPNQGDRWHNNISEQETHRSRRRRLRPVPQPASNATVVLQDADGKRRIVYYNPSTSQYANLRGEGYAHYFPPPRGKRANDPEKRNTADNIVFPGPLKGESIKKFEPKIPDRCKNSGTFCTISDNYPSTYLEGILENTALPYHEFNGTDEIESLAIGQRIDFNDEESLCISTENIIFPKAAQNKDFKWMFIVNQDKFIQGVRVETCQNENGVCEHGENFPIGYKSFCKQKYIYRKMLAIDNSGEEVVDHFRLPSCCSCALRPSSLSSKSGFDPANQSKAIRRRRNAN